LPCYHGNRKVYTRFFFLNFYDLRYFGNIGVDIFFLIIGFIMIYVHGNDFQNNMSIVFLKKRIVRVVPLYWFLTIFATLILYFTPSIFGGGKVFDLKHVISSFLFIPSKNSIGIAMPVIGPGWSLNYEIYFYIIFSLLLFFPKKYFLKLITSFF
jgi:peptidoglycan/LPS O-acetylase OafA/YrhL